MATKFAAAQKAGVMVAFEGAVAGGIPIIKGCAKDHRESHQWIAGIINGTSNFILEMRATGASFGRAR
jgi:homoserine dehydrogenase